MQTFPSQSQRWCRWFTLLAVSASLLIQSTSTQAGWPWWLRFHKPTPNLVEKLEAQGNFSTLLTALELTGLKETVAEAEALTLFAPTDDAFAALPDGTLEALIDDPETLTQILLYHVVGGKESIQELLYKSTSPTLQGSPVLVTLENWRPQVNGLPIHPYNLRASNGYIHVIQDVLLPPENEIEIASILDVLELDGRFTTLLTALELTGLDEAVANGEMLTLFAPTDDAFAALPDGTLEALVADPVLLSNILLYHVLGTKSDIWHLLRDRKAETLQGDTVQIGTEGWTVLVNESPVVNPNINAPNGIIHTIGSVLTPPEKAETTLEQLKQDGRFSTLVAALELTGLDSALEGEDALTLFAPTDDAFGRLPDGVLDSLLANPEALTDVLLYHVVAGDRDFKSLADERIVTTLLEQEVLVWHFRGFGFVNRSFVQERDIVTGNGRIHALYRVLVPQDGDDD